MDLNIFDIWKFQFFKQSAVDAWNILCFACCAMHTRCFQNSYLGLLCSLKRSWLSCPCSVLPLSNPFSQVCVKTCLYVNLHNVSYSFFLPFSFFSSLPPSLSSSLPLFLFYLFIPVDPAQEVGQCKTHEI